MIDVGLLNTGVATPPDSRYEHAPFYADLLACRKCTCRAEAKRVVPGVGPREADIFVIGQNPGKEEDATGVPFVGDSGEEFNKWLRVLGLDREKIAITNLVKCRTSANRVPTAKEITTCSTAWLRQELDYLYNVRVILPLGAPATKAILGKIKSPGPTEPYAAQVQLGERTFHVLPMAHPAYFLRVPTLRPRFALAVLGGVRDYLAAELPELYARNRQAA